MRICYLADGKSIHTQRWCNYFAGLGHEIHLISFRKSDINNATIHFVDAGEISVKGGNWKVLLKVGRIRKILRKIKPDILHAHYATSYGIVAALSGFKPLIITTLGTDILITPFQSSFYKLLITFALKRADWITAMADHMKDTMIKLGVPTSKVDIVMFGVDTKIFNKTNRNLPENKFIISSTRNFEEVYNLDLLVDALGLVKDEIPSLFVNFTGDGTLRKHIEERIDKIGLSNRCKFYGKVSQLEIAEILNNTHLFISVSLSDGNNVSLNEAMACGAVSIASDIPANTQWIEDGENGYLVPTTNCKLLAEKILKVYNNFSDLQETSNRLNDKLIQEKASWVSNMEKVVNMYNKLNSGR